MGRPLILRKDACAVCEDARYLKENGVTAIVSLAEGPLDKDAVTEQGFKYRHFPVPDGARPSLPAVRAIVETIAGLIDKGETVAVHCAAGLGRTGTVLALYLVHTGASAQEAIKMVREQEPLSIENKDQEQAVADYEGFLKKTGRQRKT